MDVSTDQLTFSVPHSGVQTKKLTISNKDSKPLVYKLKTTKPRLFTVHPNASTVPPHGKIEVNISRNIDYSQSENESSRDKFLILGANVDEATAKVAPTKLWNELEKCKESHNSFRIKVIYEENTGASASGDGAAHGTQGSKPISGGAVGAGVGACAGSGAVHNKSAPSGNAGSELQSNSSTQSGSQRPQGHGPAGDVSEDEKHTTRASIDDTQAQPGDPPKLHLVNLCDVKKGPLLAPKTDYDYSPKATAKGPGKSAKEATHDSYADSFKVTSQEQRGKTDHNPGRVSVSSQEAAASVGATGAAKAVSISKHGSDSGPQIESGSYISDNTDLSHSGAKATLQNRPKRREARSLADFVAAPLVPNARIRTPNNTTVFCALFFRTGNMVSPPQNLESMVETIRSKLASCVGIGEIPLCDFILQVDDHGIPFVGVDKALFAQVKGTVHLSSIDDQGTSVILAPAGRDPAESRVIHAYVPASLFQAMSPARGSTPAALVPIEAAIQKEGGHLLHWFLAFVSSDSHISTLRPKLVFSAIFPVGAHIPEGCEPTADCSKAYCFFCKKVGHRRPQCPNASKCPGCGSTKHDLASCRRHRQRKAASKCLKTQGAPSSRPQSQPPAEPAKPPPVPS